MILVYENEIFRVYLMRSQSPFVAVIYNKLKHNIKLKYKIEPVPEEDITFQFFVYASSWLAVTKDKFTYGTLKAFQAGEYIASYC